MTKKKVEVGIEGQYGPRVRWFFRKTSPGGFSPTTGKSGKPVARVSWNVRSLAAGGCTERNCHTAVRGEVPTETDNTSMMSIYVYPLFVCASNFPKSDGS